MATQTKRVPIDDVLDGIHAAGRTIALAVITVSRENIVGSDTTWYIGVGRCAACGDQTCTPPNDSASVEAQIVLWRADHPAVCRLTALT
ncbi:hypothetical protein MSIM_07140 [Mycobacterium simiae]|nr:hypothetical protein MSIM_07140 [Mycobacterium simiae]